MDKKILEELKQKLEQEKKAITAELQRFAQRDKKLKDDWDTKYPREKSGVGSQQLEDAADEVEEYDNLLSVEYNLELRLRDINLALEKIKKNEYGKCEKCGREIEIEKLRAYPETKECGKC